jgi:putative endonuclease
MGGMGGMGRMGGAGGTDGFAWVVIPAKAGIHEGLPAVISYAWRALGTRMPDECDSMYAPLRQSPMRNRQPCVYILASRPKGTLYVGVTSNLVKRVWQHREEAVKGCSTRYDVHQLVWYEQHGTMNFAIAREKAIKKWRRVWKIKLIEAMNPDWEDLYPSLF